MATRCRPPGTRSVDGQGFAGAREVRRVDPSQVVSKYIGETEQNIAVILDVADRDEAVLLLDEADALFGKRAAPAIGYKQSPP